MAAKAKIETTEIKKTGDTLYLKANRSLTVEEHIALSEKLSFEEEKTGLKIVLIPNSLDVSDGE
jgi:hypothetical protein